MSDGAIRLRVGGSQKGDLGLNFLSRREYASAFLSTLHLQGLPGWFREGAAEFYGHRDTTRGYWKEDRLGQIRTHFKSYGRADVTLKKMEELYLNKKIVTTVGKYEAYMQAEAMVLSIAKERGESWIPNVVQRMQAGTSWSDAYQEVVGISPEEILQRYHNTWKQADSY